MREIKFRAWDKKENKWYEPIYKAYESKLFEILISMSGQIITRGMNGVSIDFPRFELNQYTGLKDKNGKEIYEGDIVKGVVCFTQLLTGDTDENSNFKMVGEVFYDHSRFSLKVIQHLSQEDRDGMVNYFDFIGDCGETFDEKEIIGNIYENPELLTTN